MSDQSPPPDVKATKPSIPWHDDERLWFVKSCDPVAKKLAKRWKNSGTKNVQIQIQVSFPTGLFSTYQDDSKQAYRPPSNTIEPCAMLWSSASARRKLMWTCTPRWRTRSMSNCR